MKRLVSLTAALLALAMMLTLAACGNDPEPPAEDPAGEPAQTETVGSVDLTAVRDQILADCQITDYVEVAAEGLEQVYGITADQVAAFAGVNASASGAFPQEVVMIQAVDETAAADVAAKMESHLANIAETAASYDPDSLALAESCKVVTDGVYVGLFFSEHYDAMVSAFQSALG